MSITELAVKRPSLVIVIFSILVFFGLYGYNSLTYELLPDISSPVITISTAYPGATPSEVENSVTKPIENALSSLENLDAIQAVSMESFSSVVIFYFNDVLKFTTEIIKKQKNKKLKN